MFLGELGVAQRWYQRTALEDLLGVSWDKINEDRLCRGLDVLHERKEELTQQIGFAANRSVLQVEQLTHECHLGAQAFDRGLNLDFATDYEVAAKGRLCG